MPAHQEVEFKMVFNKRVKCIKISFQYVVLKPNSSATINVKIMAEGYKIILVFAKIVKFD